MVDMFKERMERGNEALRRSLVTYDIVPAGSGWRTVPHGMAHGKDTHYFG